MSLHSRITAYSSGIGDWSFLFNVLRGVETGCPLSPVLLILCMSPSIDCVNWLSDHPGFPITRVCADDFGSALDQLCRIETHASVVRLAQSVAGLHLKPCKCIINIPCITVSDGLVSAVKAWLRDNASDFQFLIAHSANHFG